MSTYYTPELSEFHLGFEYEYLHDGTWLTVEVTPDSRLRMFEDMIRDGKVRVRGLDREDVESLGWEYDNNQSEADFDWYLIEPGLDDNNHFIQYGLTHYKMGTVFLEKVIDSGVHEIGAVSLRNKSELKMIMKMLGIKL